ncbi:MAG: hypothetical protein ACXWPG_03190 [Ktedonobacteraceae bacterium]
MNNTTQSIQKAILFWLSGIRLSDIQSLPEGRELIDRSAIVGLHMSPITGRQNQHYQVLSGREPSSFGYFDTLVPVEYAIVEESTGPGTVPKLLPDILRTAGWMVTCNEIQPSELVNCVEHWTQCSTSLPSCLIAKCTIEDTSTLNAFSNALSVAKEWVGETGLVAVLSDTQAAPVKRFVNVNNFLAGMDVIERDEASGQIHWSNSLAFFAGHGQLWINLLGRDAQGIVHPHDEYEQVRETLIKVLPAKLIDQETGESVIERVYRKEEIYAADFLFCAPDLVVLFKPGYAPSQRSTRIEFDESIFTTPEPGTTTTEGIHPSQLGGFLLVSAPILVHGVALSESVSLTRIYPTLLHALGVERAELEIAAISALFHPAYLETHAISCAKDNQELSDKDEELLFNRLRDLGYV